jgi:DNA repair protein RadA/Sms
MAKQKSLYICEECGARFPKWMGKCTQCGEWNTLIEQVETPTNPEHRAATHTHMVSSTAPQPLSAVPDENIKRTDLPMAEFNRVLGGGLVPGSIALIGGDPGVGKSTLLLQISAAAAQKNPPILYVSGEESIYQIKMRATRMGYSEDQLYILNEINVNAIIEHIRQLKPTLVVIDSIQTVYRPELSSMPGSVTQVRESAMQFQQVAKGLNIPVFLIGHVTKDGSIAGPRVLEHIVDVVLYLEGERFHSYRLLRGVKNRFGATNEVGIFEMQSTGLTEVPNPSEIFLAERLPNASGSAIAVTMEGTRPLLVEIQALASTTSFGNPRRTPNGVDMNRLLLLIAVLSKRVGLRLGDQDVFVNVVGGLRVNEPAADLAIALAMASSFRNRPVAADVVLLGEIGLSGELRAVGHLESRLKETQKLGFKRCVLPKSNAGRDPIQIEGLRLLYANTLPEALELALT